MLRGSLPVKNITLKFSFMTKMPIFQRSLVVFYHPIRFWKRNMINFTFVKNF